MFGLPLRRSFLLLIVAVAGAVGAGRAAAATDVTEVSLSVRIARSTLGADQIEAEFRVKGSDLANGTIALPSAPDIQVPFALDGDDLVREDTFANEQELNAILSNGNYLLRINDASATATIAYTRPAVPSPAISYPEDAVVPPGPIEVMFAPCSVCNLVGDTVEAVLEDDMAALLAEETLTSSSESWVPQDGMAGDLALAEESLFVVRLTHTAVRQGNVAVTGDDEDNTLLFSGSFEQSDEVGFETGSNPPEGHFCLAVNHPAPPLGCETLADPLLQIFDTSGTFSTEVGGHDVDCSVSVDPAGRLTGSASADLDDDDTNETGPAPIKGKLGGKGGEAKSKLSFPLANAGLGAKLKLSIGDVLSIAGDTRSRVQRASGSLAGAKLKEETTSSDSPLPDAPLGWLLEYDLAADGAVSDAVLTLENGRTFPLAGSNKFKLKTDQSNLKLTSEPKGVSITLKKLGLDDASEPMTITGGELGYKALGQSGRATLP